MRAALVRYAGVAVPVRLADEAARVALILLALDRTASAALGGQVIAALMVPHVLAAPLVGGLADRVRHRRTFHAAAIGVFAAGLAVGAALLGRAPVVLVLIAVTVAGCAAPALTGGLSSLLRDLIPPAARDRAYALDALTYNVAGIAGPGLAAAVASAAGPAVAAVAVVTSATAGGLAVGTLRLPPRLPPGEGQDARESHDARESSDNGRRGRARPGALDGAVALWRVPVLRAVTAATAIAAAGTGALALVAALLATEHHAGWATGAFLSAFAAAALPGSVAFARRRKGVARPERVVVVALVLAAPPLAAVPLVDNLPVQVVLFALGGLLTGPQFSALLAARSRYAPPAVHAQVFTVAAGLKVTAAAFGAWAAGAAAGLGGEWLIVAVAASQAVAGLVGMLILRGARREPGGEGASASRARQDAAV